MNERFDPETGEISEGGNNLPALVDTTMVVAIAKAELDARVVTARAYPRSVSMVVQNILSLATLTEEMAQDCIYALPRGGKPIKGPSIRLAEITSQCWGNCISESRVIAVDRINKTLTAEGIFHDLETNAVVKSTAERRISDKKGRLFNDDMIAVTGNAARSIARRNAVFSGVPKGIWQQAYDRCVKVVAGDITTLAVNREKAVKSFAAFGLKPEQVYFLLDVKGEQDIGLDDITTLRGMFSSIKNGEATVEELLSEATRSSTNFEKVANPLKDEAPSGKKQTASNGGQHEGPVARDPVGGGGAGANTSTEGQSEISAADGGAQKEAHPPDGQTEAAKVAPGSPISTPVSSDSALAVAKARGAADFNRGLQRKAVPVEYRTDQKAAESTAWAEGWNAESERSKQRGK